MFGVEFVDGQGLVIQAGACTRVAHSCVEFWLFLIVDINVLITSLTAGPSVLRCRNFGLRDILSKFKSLLTCCLLAHRDLFDLSRQWISLDLHSDLLSVLSGRLFLLLGALPLFASDVCSKTAKLRVLGLQLHLLEIF